MGRRRRGAARRVLNGTRASRRASTRCTAARSGRPTGWRTGAWRRGDQLPPVLRHQRPRGAAHARTPRVFEATHRRVSSCGARRQRARPAHRPSRRPGRPRGLSRGGCTRRAAALGATREHYVSSRRSSARTSRAARLAGARHHRLRIHVRRERRVRHAPGEGDFDAVYAEFTRERDSYDALLYRAKRRSCRSILSSELTVLANG